MCKIWGGAKYMIAKILLVDDEIDLLAELRLD